MDVMGQQLIGKPTVVWHMSSLREQQETFYHDRMILQHGMISQNESDDRTAAVLEIEQTVLYL